MENVEIKEEVVEKKTKKPAKKEEVKALSPKNEALIKFMEDRNAKRLAANLPEAYSIKDFEDLK